MSKNTGMLAKFSGSVASLGQSARPICSNYAPRQFLCLQEQSKGLTKSKSLKGHLQWTIRLCNAKFCVSSLLHHMQNLPLLSAWHALRLCMDAAQHITNALQLSKEEQVLDVYTAHTSSDIDNKELMSTLQTVSMSITPWLCPILRAVTDLLVHQWLC